MRDTKKIMSFEEGMHKFGKEFNQENIKGVKDDKSRKEVMGSNGGRLARLS